MEREEIIKKFLGSGLQLQPEVLDVLEARPELVDAVIERARLSGATIVTMELLEARGPRILQVFKPLRKKHSVEDVVKGLAKRYEVLRGMLEAKLQNPISINRVTPRSKEFSLIGMISQVDEGWLEVDDFTGSVKLLSSNGQLLPNEIVGLSCRRTPQGIEAKVVWPDIPLRKEVSRASSSINCLFISDLHMEFGGFDKAAFEKLLRILEGVRGELYVLVLGDISPDEEQAKGFLEELPGEKVFVKGEADPEMEDAMPACMLEIDGVKLLLMHGKILEPYTRGFESPAQLLLHLLRARHLNPSHLGSDPYLLEVVPDICAIGHFHEAGMLNYKGTTILTLGSFRTKPIYWIIDLKTREISRIELGK